MLKIALLTTCSARCPNFYLVDMVDTISKSNLGEGKVYFDSHVWSSIEWNQGRNSSRSLKHKPYMMLLASLTQDFLPQLRTICLGMVPLTVDWSFLCQLKLRQYSSVQKPMGQSKLGNPSIETSFSDDSGLCQVEN